MQKSTASTQNIQEELRTLAAATRLHLLSYPLPYVPGNEETKEFFHKPIKYKTLSSKLSPATSTTKTAKPSDRTAPRQTTTVHNKEAEQDTKRKAIPSSTTAATAAPLHAPLVKQIEVVNPYLKLAARPFLHHSPLVFEDIAAKAPTFPKRKTSLVESLAPMPWIQKHPKAIIIASCPECFLPFIQSVSNAIGTKLCPVALYTSPQDDDWAEIVTHASTGKTKAIISFVDRKEQDPYSSIKSFIEETPPQTVEPFQGYGTLFGVELLEIVVDHDLVESKPRKSILWNALGSLYA